MTLIISWWVVNLLIKKTIEKICLDYLLNTNPSSLYPFYFILYPSLLVLIPRLDADILHLQLT
ncbi:MAG: hypothetical protein WCW84_14185, partial [Sulfurimonas sp.]